MKFIVKLTNIFNGHLTEYLGSGTYLVSGERYANVVGNRKEMAKRYSSRARAESAVEKLSESCQNIAIMDYTIEEVEE